MIRFILASLCLVLIFPAVSNAKGSVKVGDIIPTNLEFKDHKEKVRNFSNLTGSKGMVLVFIRSAEWCPFCQKQLKELSDNAKEFSDAGYSVVSVSYDALPQLQKFVTTQKPKITLLSDPSSESIRAFGILNGASAKGTMSYGIPHPGVFIIDKNKKVQAKFFESDYKKRPSSKTLLAKIKSLNEPVVPPMTIESMGTDPIAPEEQFITTPEKLAPIMMPDEPVIEDIQEPVAEIVPNATNVPELLPTEVNAPTDAMPSNELIKDKLLEAVPTVEDVPATHDVM
jgi:peroxiredoxin